MTTLEGDRVVHHPINNSLESYNSDSQCNPEAKPKKKKRKRKLKDKDASIDIHGHTTKMKDDSIGTTSCQDSLVEINAQKEFKTAALSVLSSNNSSLKSHNLDSQCNPEAEQPQLKKKKRKRKLNDKAALIDIQGGGGTYMLKDDSIGANSCLDSLAEINAKIDFSTAPKIDFSTTSLPVLRRSNNSLESHNIDSQSNPAAEYPKPKIKKRRRKLKDKDVLIDIHGDSCMLKDDPCGANSCHDSLADVNAQTEYKTAAFPVLSLSRSNNSLSHSVDSQRNSEPECPQPKKKKRRKKVKDKDASIDIHGNTSIRNNGSVGTNSCHDSLAETTVEINVKTAPVPVLSRNNNSLESHEIDSHCNPEAECSQLKKKKVKRKLKDKDASVDIHGDTSTLRDVSICTNSFHDSLGETNAEIKFKTTSLPVLSRKNNSLLSHNIDSHCNPEAEFSQPKKKKVKRKLKDKDASIDIHGDASTLRYDSIGANSRHDSLVVTNTAIKFKTAAFPVLSRDNKSSESQNIDSHCNPKAVCSQPKKKKVKRKLKDKDASIDIHGDTYKLGDDSIGTNSCHDSLAETNAEIKLKTAALPVLSRNINSLESHNIDSHCNPEAECSQPKKKKVKRKLKDKDASDEVHGDTAMLKDDPIGTNSCYDSLAEINALTEFETAELPVLSRSNNCAESDNIDSRCNPEAACSQPKKKKVKRKLKDKDALTDIHGDTSKPKVDSNGINSCHDSLAKINAQNEFNTAALLVLSSNNSTHNIYSQCNPEAECPQLKKKKKKKILKDKDFDIHDTSMLKGDLIGTLSCHEPLTKINAEIEFKTAAPLVLSRNNNTNSAESHNIESRCDPEAKCPQPKKKKRKRKMRGQDFLIDLHVDTSTLQSDLIATNSYHESLVKISATTKSGIAANPVLSSNKKSLESHNTDSQCNPEAECPQPVKKKRKRKLKDKDASIDIHVDTSKLKDDFVVTNSCHDSSIEISAQRDLETDSLPESSRSIRKTLKLNSSGNTDKVHVSLVDLDLTGTEEKALISEKQIDPLGSPSASLVNEHNGGITPSVVETESDKKKRNKVKKKKQKIDTKVIFDNAHNPHADVDVTKMDRGDLLSGKQNDQRSACVNMVKKDDNDDKGTSISYGIENVKKKIKRDKKQFNTSVISDKAHVPPADLDRSDEKNVFIYVKEIDHQSTPSSNQGGTHILVGKENTKTSHIEEKPRSHSRKRRKSSSSKENSDKNQSGIPCELSLPANETLEEDLVTMAAEAIVSVSSSEVQKGASLDWFAKLASSAVDDPKSEFGIGLSCKNEVSDYGMDYFEAMTLQLEETMVEEYSCQVTGIEVEAAYPASLPRRGRARKGRKQRQKNFQREVLPSLATLSSSEVKEDLQALGMLIEATGRNGWTRRRGRPS